ncbi:MAG TPA: RICIN domain-containing protein [Polyangia bacterium]|nr:RICIN domain-containing protein [Polyangia bacterium]
MVQKLGFCTLFISAALALSGCSGGSVDAEGSGPPDAVTSGGPIVRQGSGKCLDATNAGTADGTKIEQSTCNGLGAESFLLEPVSGGVHMVNSHSGKCVQTVGTSNGSKIETFTCSTSAAQTWVAEDENAGYWQLRNPSSNKCLDVASASNASGATVQLYTCNGTNAQQWQ